MDSEAWWATVRGVAKSQLGLVFYTQFWPLEDRCPGWDVGLGEVPQPTIPIGTMTLQGRFPAAECFEKPHQYDKAFLTSRRALCLLGVFLFAHFS